MENEFIETHTNITSEEETMGVFEKSNIFGQKYHRPKFPPRILIDTMPNNT